MVTSQQVAQLAGVSRATVSRVLNGSPRISEEARQRVLAAVAALGYEPDTAAQSLVRQKSRMIALGLPGQDPSPSFFTSLGKTAHYFYIDVLAHIEQETFAAGYDLIIPSHARSKIAEGYIRGLQTRRIAGALMLSISPEDSRIEGLLQSNIPTVFVDTAGMGERAIHIRSNHQDGSRQLVEHLLALGHRRIAFVIGQLVDMAAAERFLGCQQALANAGIPLDPALVCQTGWNTDEAYQGALDLLDRRRDFTAIVAGSDLMALGVMRALYERNLRVPDDISLAGADDVVLSQFAIPPLTTIRQDRQLIAQEAVQRLLALIEGREVSSFIAPTQLVIRNSTGPVPERE